MFIMYFGCLSMITPPVALAAFAAAKIADARPMPTAFYAVQLGWTAFFMPFLFVFSPTLLMQGDTIHIVVAVITAAAGIWLTSAGLTGYLRRTISWDLRLLYIISGLALIIPPGTFPAASLVQIAGGIVGAASLLWDYWSGAKKNKAQFSSERKSFS